MRQVGRDHVCVAFLEGQAENVCVCVAFLERRAPNRGSFKNAAEHNKYLILIPERITLSLGPTCSSTTTTASLSPSVRSKNVMQLERAPNRDSLKIAAQNVMQLERAPNRGSLA